MACAAAKAVANQDFSNLDVSNMNYQPIENDIIVQNLSDLSDKEIIRGEKIDFDAYNAKLKIAEYLLKKSEIDYDKCSELINKLIEQTCTYFTRILVKMV